MQIKQFIQALFPNLCLLCRNGVAPPAMLCQACTQGLPWRQEPFTLFHYQSPIDHFINQLKFHGQLIYARFFSQCFIAQLKNHSTPLPDYLLPVPLHRHRLQQRGFNQALEIAKPIAKHYKIPLATHCCHRQKPTKPQSDLSAVLRAQNVKNAFVINQPLNAKHVAIFDDVVTTGSTVSELTQLLKNQGVMQIEVWCVAKPNKRSD